MRVKRAYEPAEETDGYRVLVDRLWPRGVSKREAQLDEWARGLAPSPELRRWFGHDPARFPEFRRRYREELAVREDELEALRTRAQDGTVTLVYAARDIEHNGALVVSELLRDALDETTSAEILAEVRIARSGDDGVAAIVALLHDRVARYSWVGFYRLEGDELVLGPWRGAAPTVHVRIPAGRGICGAAAASGRTELVDDVRSDGRYLACFASTRSELVVPVRRGGRVVGELDVDSDLPAAFGDADRRLLEHVAALIADLPGEAPER